MFQGLSSGERILVAIVIINVGHLIAALPLYDWVTACGVILAWVGVLSAGKDFHELARARRGKRMVTG